jgi:DnaK suppressor protein
LTCLLETRVNTDEYRRRLGALEQELVERLGQEVHNARASADPSDVDDRAHTDERNDEYLTLAQTDSDILKQVRDALGRIERGTYGRCVVDGGPIEAKRLDAVPWTPYCLKHEAEIEEGARIRTPSL